MAASAQQNSSDIKLIFAWRADRAAPGSIALVTDPRTKRFHFTLY
jgi:hypothetical protein